MDSMNMMKMIWQHTGGTTEDGTSVLVGNANPTVCFFRPYEPNVRYHS